MVKDFIQKFKYLRVENGGNRKVFIFKNFVVKIPNTFGAFNIEDFLLGVECNLREFKNSFYSFGLPTITLVFVNIQPRCEVLNYNGSCDYMTPKDIPYYDGLTLKEQRILMVDSWKRNFGYWRGKLYKFDLGDSTGKIPYIELNYF